MRHAFYIDGIVGEIRMRFGIQRLAIAADGQVSVFSYPGKAGANSTTAEGWKAWVV